MISSGFVKFTSVPLVLGLKKQANYTISLLILLKV